MTVGGEREPAHAPWLRGITVAYLVWSLLPLLLVVVYSFNAGDTVTHWQGFSLRWWIGDPSAAESIVYDPETRTPLGAQLGPGSLTTVIAVPIGTMFALGCRGWHSWVRNAGLTIMLIALVLPPIAIGAAMWLLLAYPLRSIPFGEFGWFGTRAQLVGLVTMFLPIVTLVVWARLVFLDREQEEMAADLGAPPGDVLGRVILPQIRLAILAGAAVVFAGRSASSSSWTNWWGRTTREPRTRPAGNRHERLAARERGRDHPGDHRRDRVRPPRLDIRLRLQAVATRGKSEIDLPALAPTEPIRPMGSDPPALDPRHVPRLIHASAAVEAVGGPAHSPTSRPRDGSMQYEPFHVAPGRCKQSLGGPSRSELP